MSSHAIHILLLDDKTLCINYKELTSEILIKHLCTYLNLQKPETVGLLYKDSRGSLQWLDESKLILDHDIATDNEFIPLIFKIRHIPHHLCYNEPNVHQLFLLSVRLLKQNWFISKTEIHSQLIALYILFKYGSELYESNFEDVINQSNLQIYHPTTKENFLNTIINAYSVYRKKLKTLSDFVLKILQLMMVFPIFNSKLFVVTDSRAQKFVLGINSVEISLFYLKQFQEPFAKYKFAAIENVMHRGIKIIIDLKHQKSQSPRENSPQSSIQNPQFSNESVFDHDFSDDSNKLSLTPKCYLENEMFTFYALSPHQSNCIYSEIQTSRNIFRESPPICKISDLRKNPNFVKTFNNWLCDQYFNLQLDREEHHTKDGLAMFIIQEEHDDENINSYFGETSIFDTDIYQKSYPDYTTSDSAFDFKPDFEQLLSEESRLKEILKEKLFQLQESFIMEEKITGVVSKDVFRYFPNGIPKFLRNSRHLPQSRHQHRGCAASVRNKINAMDSFSPHGTNRPDSKESALYSSRSANNSLAYGKNKSLSRSVADLSTMSNGSVYQSNTVSQSSIRSCDEKKYRTTQRSTNNLFFNGSPKSDKNSKSKTVQALRMKSQGSINQSNLDSTDMAGSKTKYHNSSSELKSSLNTPRPEIVVSKTPNSSRSNQSSPLILHSKSPQKLKHQNRNSQHK